MNFEETCKLLEENGFRKVAHFHDRLTYHNEDNTVHIVISKLNVDMTEKEIKQVEARLKELGYMD